MPLCLLQGLLLLQLCGSGSPAPAAAAQCEQDPHCGLGEWCCLPGGGQCTSFCLSGSGYAGCRLFLCGLLALRLCFPREQWVQPTPVGSLSHALHPLRPDLPRHEPWRRAVARVVAHPQPEEGRVQGLSPPWSPPPTWQLGIPWRCHCPALPARSTSAWQCCVAADPES